jgi:hypothetical protein
MDFAYSLVHFIYPKASNNHKAKLLHSSSIFVLACFLILYQIVLQTFPLSRIKILGYAASIPTTEVIRLTNAKRLEAGVGSLNYNSLLSEAARLKGQDMLAKGYWAHVAPDGTEPWYFFTKTGYKYKYAGENLARDFSNPTDAVNAWMASPSHRENLLSDKYKDIGIAVVEGSLSGVDTTIIVQLFGTPLGTVSEQVPVAKAATQVATNKVAPATPTVTITPTEAPMASPQPSPQSILVGGSSNDTNKPDPLQILVSPFESTRGISLGITALLLIVLVIDGVVVARKRISRVSGKSFAHFAFLGMVLTIILMAKAGKIL